MLYWHILHKMIEIVKHSGVYTLTAEQLLPITLEKAWEFFSSPGNLKKITPEQMGFSITSKEGGQMYPGQIITYRVGIFPGIKSNWVTEITYVEKNNFFVDEQRVGPYKMWHHEHHFEKVGNGVLMKDMVTYRLPFGWMGSIAHAIFIRAQLKKIFGYRYQVLSDYFKDWER